MLNIHTGGSFSRRSFLQIGGLALGGLTLPDLLRARAADGRSVTTDRSVIFLFLHGGPPQAETFDPKMTAPEGVRSLTGEVKTSLPGITFGGTMNHLAKLADRLTVVRSFTTGDANHDIKPIVGRDSFGANLGSIYARIAGTNRPDTGLPTNVILFPRAVDSRTQGAVTQFGKFGSTGSLGASHAPFDPSVGDGLTADMKLHLPMDRLDDRRRLLAELDRVKGALADPRLADGIDRVRQQAFDTILGSAAAAFDLSKEPTRVVERYDTEPLVSEGHIRKKWNNHKNYLDNAQSLGKLLLLGRRLCERGCGFVTITTNFVWDFHADSNNAGVVEGMDYMGGPLDHAVGAFIEDVEARGLSDKILLVVCGEMGRTPRVNAKGGRDHWGNLAPLLLFGGGLNMGKVIGSSDKQAAAPQSDPVTNQNLIATILHTLFDVPELRLKTGVPREIGQTMVGWEPIPGLLA
jgi:Protein of unknown function (DUF1501)